MPTRQQVLDDPEMSACFDESFPRKCGCGASYDEAQWEKLRYVGIQKVPEEIHMPDLELRNCANCSSTMSIAVCSDFVED